MNITTGQALQGVRLLATRIRELSHFARETSRPSRPNVRPADPAQWLKRIVEEARVYLWMAGDIVHHRAAVGRCSPQGYRIGEIHRPSAIAAYWNFAMRVLGTLACVLENPRRARNQSVWLSGKSKRVAGDLARGMRAITWGALPRFTCTADIERWRPAPLPEEWWQNAGAAREWIAAHLPRVPPGLGTEMELDLVIIERAIGQGAGQVEAPARPGKKQRPDPPRVPGDLWEDDQEIIRKIAARLDQVKKIARDGLGNSAVRHRMGPLKRWGLVKRDKAAKVYRLTDKGQNWCATLGGP